MRITTLLALLVAMLVPAVHATADPPSDIHCPGLFTGVAPHDLIVDPNTGCDVEGATVVHDLIVLDGADLEVAGTTIGHDLRATKPDLIEAGLFFGGPVSIAHDLDVNGSPSGGGAFIDLCDTTIKHDLTVQNTMLFDELEIGDKDEFCDLAGSPGDTVGHDITVKNNHDGEIDVGDNTVTHDITVLNNTADFYIDVSDNAVGHKTTCKGNSPPPSSDGIDDVPNC